MINLLHAFNSVLPVFLVILLGALLKKAKLINDDFIRTGSLIVFRVTLPVVVFTSIAAADLSGIFDWRFSGAGIAATSAVFALALAGAALFGSRKSLGAAVQGAFRSNCAIIGFSVIMNAFGPDALGPAAMLLAVLMILFNVLAVAVLAWSARTPGRSGPGSVLKSIITNPLIIAVVLAVPFSVFSIRIPFPLLITMKQLGQITLPLGLIGIGGSLSFKDTFKTRGPVLMAVILKLVVMPVIAVTIAFLGGLRGQFLGVLFVMSASPAAVASFIMARGMKNDHVLAANIVAVTTACSILTLSLGLGLLMKWGLV